MNAPAWTDDIAPNGAPRYIAIADAVERAIGRGVLAPGAQLPPHRVLAAALDIDVSTVTRAYSEIKRRGLTSGEVGRGTFIRRRAPDAPPSLWQHASVDGFIDLSHNFPATAPDNPAQQVMTEAWEAVARSQGLFGLQADSGHRVHREVLAQWLEECHGLQSRPSEIVITTGAQHGLMLAIQAVTRPDEALLCEGVTFYGALSAAKFLGRRVEPVEIDGEGLIPAALDRAFVATGARTLYCNPTLHNPTTSIMGTARREAIVQICRRHDATIVEDDVYGFLINPRVATLCSLAPERTVYVTGFSKITGPGVRVGMIRAPGHLVPHLGAGLRASTLMAPAPMVELICQTVKNGGMQQMANARLAQVTQSQTWASEIFGTAPVQRQPQSFHAWLPIGAWRSEAFASVARERGVGVAPGALFNVATEPRDGGAVRICVSAAQDRASLLQALRVLSTLIAEGPHAARTIV